MTPVRLPPRPAPSIHLPPRPLLILSLPSSTSSPSVYSLSTSRRSLPTLGNSGFHFAHRALVHSQASFSTGPETFGSCFSPVPSRYFYQYSSTEPCRLFSLQALLRPPTADAMNTIKELSLYALTWVLQPPVGPICRRIFGGWRLPSRAAAAAAITTIWVFAAMVCLVGAAVWFALAGRSLSYTHRAPRRTPATFKISLGPLSVLSDFEDRWTIDDKVSRQSHLSSFPFSILSLPILALFAPPRRARVWSARAQSARAQAATMPPRRWQSKLNISSLRNT
ncbi:hypothetical protein HDK77DRAFT_2116 [Phyllosticta capitalensis]